MTKKNVARQPGKSIFWLAVGLVALCLSTAGPPPFTKVAGAHIAPEVGAAAPSVIDNDADDRALHRAEVKARWARQWTPPDDMRIDEWGPLELTNALTIIRVGCKLGLPPRAHEIAVATAMQESSLLNTASSAVPESFNYPHQGDSVDSDSVGLFQQRPSQGWGAVAQLMDPEYAATKFYEKLGPILARNPGIKLTVAAQAVQISGYPNAYQKHEPDAVKIVQALEPYCLP